MENSNADGQYNITSVLSSPNRDFLVRNNGDEVNVNTLNGSIVGLYFSASWCGPCLRFTPNLIEVYNELNQLGKEFEIVFISRDRDNESFDSYFSKMPWLAIPFSDSETREQLSKLFAVRGIPHLVILDANGKVLTVEGVEIIQEHGVEGYPFVQEHIEKLIELEEEARKNQSLKSLLVSQSRDYLIAPDGKEVLVGELEGKTVGLYFVLFTYKECLTFNSKLVEVYKSLKEEGGDFEIVVIPLDEDEVLFKKEFELLPWLALPLKDKYVAKLIRYFELKKLPTLVVIGPDGKTLHSNVVEAIEEHGKKAYPFTSEKFAELEEIEKEKREAQTLESILVSNECDYVIGKDGAKIPVSNLVGKNILLYFSAHWCPPCRAFLPKLIQAYQQINTDKDNSVNSLEVIFISSDRDQESFNNFFSTMPWLALPFGDKRKQYLSRLFKVKGIPKVVAIGPTGKTVTTDARELIMYHGAKAFPFTANRIEEIETENEKMAEKWPKKVNKELHEHELVLTKRVSYYCDGCSEEGRSWSYYCKDCDFDLHAKCALDEDDYNGKKEEDEERKGGEGWICDEDKCYKK